MPGPLRDALVAAVLAGEKVATSSLLLQYEDGNEPLPRVADLQLAIDEGEGFRTVEEWREAHEEFWVECVRPASRDPDKWVLDDSTNVVVERFRVVDVHRLHSF